ncbi:MAG: MFS transporter [Phycisphaerae bacterium]|nr:MFS transporter [Phycisphaerae bacterium]
MRIGWLKLQYALLYAVVGAYLPYMPIFLHDLGLSEAEIGWVLGVYGLAVLVMPAIMTHLADRHLSNRTLIAAGYGLSAMALLALASCKTLGGCLVFSFLFSIAYTPIFSLLDGLTFTHARGVQETGGTPPPYPRVRLWGSVGFMLPAFALYLGIEFLDWDVRAAILGAAVLSAVGLLACFALPPEQSPASKRRERWPALLAWRTMLQPPMRTVIGALFLGFMAISVFYAFYSRLLQELGVGTEWVGLIITLSVLAEIPCVVFCDAIVRKIGFKAVLLIGAASALVRLLALALAPSVGVAVVTQILHGPTVLWLYILPPAFLNRHAAETYRNSIQGIYSVLCFGVARLLGSVAGGYVALGGLENAFALAAGLSGAAMVWMWFALPGRDPTVPAGSALTAHG